MTKKEGGVPLMLSFVTGGSLKRMMTPVRVIDNAVGFSYHFSFLRDMSQASIVGRHPEIAFSLARRLVD
jgi:hypothetical protein